MKKWFTNNLSILLSAILLFSAFTAFPFSAYAAVEDSETVGVSGTTGDCTWTTSGFNVTIDGTGAMDNYSYTNASPWGSKITSANISDGVTNIGDYAFDSRQSLSNVTIGNSVTSIGECAFKNCKSLINIDIPDSVTSIGSTAFYHCNGLKNISFGKSVESIASSAFSFCENLTVVTMPNSVKSIGDSAFRYCTYLRSVSIGNAVTNVEAYAFMDCKNCTSITIPYTVKNIGEKAFGYYILRNNGNMVVAKVTGFTIYGVKGSAAEQYARDNSFIFKAISNDHPLLGDANVDGIIDINDATCIQKHLAGFNVSDYVKEASDTNEDGYVTIGDVTEIQRYLANSPCSENIGKPIG